MGVKRCNRVRDRNDRRRGVRGDPVRRRHRRLHRRRTDQHHRPSAQHPGLSGAAGYSTVEAALGIATLVAILVLCAAGVSAVALQLRCVDAAREVARLAARGDSAATASAAGLAPAGASVDVRREGGYVIARVAGRSALLPGIVIAGRAVAAAEPGR